MSIAGYDGMEFKYDLKEQCREASDAHQYCVFESELIVSSGVKSKRKRSHELC